MLSASTLFDTSRLFIFPGGNTSKKCPGNGVKFLTKCISYLS